MVDIVDAATRSRMMAGIRGKDTKPELVLRRGLHALGFRYVLHNRKLPGSPDLVFPKHHAVVFVHGCFWHRHEGCRYASVPSTRPDFWREKFERNVERDRNAMRLLRHHGWRVAVVWECAMRRDPAVAVTSVATWLIGEDADLVVERHGPDGEVRGVRQVCLRQAD